MQCETLLFYNLMYVLNISLLFGAPKAGGAIGNRNTFLLRAGRHQQVVMPALSVIQMGNISSTEAVRLPSAVLRPTCIFLAHTYFG